MHRGWLRAWGAARRESHTLGAVEQLREQPRCRGPGGDLEVESVPSCSSGLCQTKRDAFGFRGSDRKEQPAGLTQGISTADGLRASGG